MNTWKIRLTLKIIIRFLKDDEEERVIFDVKNILVLIANSTEASNNVIFKLLKHLLEEKCCH